MPGRGWGDSNKVENEGSRVRSKGKSQRPLAAQAPSRLLFSRSLSVLACKMRPLPTSQYRGEDEMGGANKALSEYLLQVCLSDQSCCDLS